MNIDGFTASNKWLHRFKLCNGIRWRQISGEAESVDKASVCAWLSDLLPPLQDDDSIDFEDPGSDISLTDEDRQKLRE